VTTSQCKFEQPIGASNT